MGYISVIPPYTLIVSVDNHPLNPRSFECFGRLICFHSYRVLGDPHSYENYNAFLRDIVPNDAARADQMNTAELLRAAESENILMPVYMKEEAGISISAMPVWTYDSIYALEKRQAGWIYVSHEHVKQEFSAESLTPELIENAKILLYGEVDYYNNYLCGECYRFDLYQRGRPIANYTGLLGVLDDVKKEIEDLIPDECRGITDKLRRVDYGSDTVSAQGFVEPLIPSFEMINSNIQPANTEMPRLESNTGNRQIPVDVDIFPINDPAGIILGIVNIVIDGMIALNGITIERRSDELSVIMPKATDLNRRTFQACAVLSKELRAYINTKVIEAYKSKIGVKKI